ncbi:PP2C family protein-serine/threonine phosphatase [Streptomyces sp. GSL17-111]|uniref:PP2C family protein-serine/threonine phosphatase n=1 Tax=Streptomyces sp. GSL17-111 TaxID=3121596 RepID=UPI0030F48D86
MGRRRRGSGAGGAADAAGARGGAPFAPDRTRTASRPRESLGRRLSLWLPPVLIAVGSAAQALTPTDFVFAALFAAAPLVAAPLYSARATAVTGVVSTIALVWLLHINEGIDLFEGSLRVATVATVSVLAVALNRVVRRGERRLASARDIAEAAQLALLPPPEHELGPLVIAARYQAAREDASIGGDLYAVQATPHGVRLLVGDVRGKGLEAVGSVVIVLGAFREAADTEPDLAQVAVRLDRALRREGRRRAGSVDSMEGFTTAVLVEVTDDGRLRVVNCGHPTPWLIHPDGRLERVEPVEPAPPLGLAALPAEGAVPPPVGRVSFPVGATLLMNTDGLTEARDPHGVFYDLSERFRAHEWTRGGPDELLDAVLADVARYTGGPPSDDLALLAVTYRDGTKHL